MELFKRLRLSLALLFSVIIAGIVGYAIIEKWSLWDSLYMTIITISTVGFREIKHLSRSGQLFTIFLILAGTGTAFYVLFSIAEFTIEGHLTGYLKRRRMEREIEQLEQHYILCGFGRVGEQVAEEFAKAKVPFVVIENNRERCKECEEQGYNCIEGDASNDEILTLAGIHRARGLVAAVDTDADNVFVTLSAKVLNPRIYIVARAVLEESVEKLRRAGADRVVSPVVIGGKRMASLMLRPIVSDYLDVVSHGDALEYQLEEIEVKEDSSIARMTIGEADIRRRTGVVVLAVRKKTGEFNTNPSSITLIEVGDKMVVLGTRTQLEELQKLV
jgi:voltage-gated potassium channel